MKLSDQQPCLRRFKAANLRPDFYSRNQNRPKSVYYASARDKG